MAKNHLVICLVFIYLLTNPFNLFQQSVQLQTRISKFTWKHKIYNNVIKLCLTNIFTFWMCSQRKRHIYFWNSIKTLYVVKNILKLLQNKMCIVIKALNWSLLFNHRHQKKSRSDIFIKPSTMFHSCFKANRKKAQ